MISCYLQLAYLFHATCMCITHAYLNEFCGLLHFHTHTLTRQQKEVPINLVLNEQFKFIQIHSYIFYKYAFFKSNGFSDFQNSKKIHITIAIIIGIFLCFFLNPVCRVAYSAIQGVSWAGTSLLHLPQRVANVQ